MTDCAGGCPVAATASASRARSSCARARRARARLGTESKGLEVLLASQLNLAGCREQEAEVGVADRITTILAEVPVHEVA